MGSDGEDKVEGNEIEGYIFECLEGGLRQGEVFSKSMRTNSLCFEGVAQGIVV